MKVVEVRQEGADVKVGASMRAVSQEDGADLDPDNTAAHRFSPRVELVHFVRQASCDSTQFKHAAPCQQLYTTTLTSGGSNSGWQVSLLLCQ